MRLILKDKGGKKYCYFLVLTCGFSYFGKWGNIRKRVHWNRKLRLLCTIWFQENSIYCFTPNTYVVAIILKNGAKFRYAKVGLKNYRNLNNFRQAVKSPKELKFDRRLSKKIHSAKTYTVDLSNITFNYLCVDSPNYLCHLWNHKSFFTAQFLCIFLVKIFRLFYCSG